VRSLGEAVAIASKHGKPETNSQQQQQQQQQQKGEGEAQGDMAALLRKVEEYRATLEQMDQHMGMLYLREVMQKGAQV
jgi:hypothetical protein